MLRRAFISQPMNGKDKFTILQERESLVKRLEDDGYDVIDSVLPTEAPDDVNKPIYLLAHSLELLSMADTLVMMPNWRSANGCRIEHECARAYGLDILEV